MARLDPMGIAGRVGKFIHYRIGDKYYVRSAPKKYKQTKATRASANVFGRASKFAGVLRGQLTPVIPNLSDRNMRGRLVAALFRWLNSIGDQRAGEVDTKEINGFSFTETKKSVWERWKVSCEINYPSSGLVEINIPAFVPKQSIKAPAGTSSVICTIATGVSDVSKSSDLGSFSTQLIFNYDDIPVAGQTIPMQLPTPGGSLIVTGISLEYRISKKRHIASNKNADFMPAEIVDAKYTGA